MLRNSVSWDSAICLSSRKPHPPPLACAPKFTGEGGAILQLYSPKLVEDVFSEVRLELGAGLIRTIGEPAASDPFVFEHSHHPPVAHYPHVAVLFTLRVAGYLHHVALLDASGPVLPSQFGQITLLPFGLLAGRQQPTQGSNSHPSFAFELCGLVAAISRDDLEVGHLCLGIVVVLGGWFAGDAELPRRGSDGVVAYALGDAVAHVASGVEDFPIHPVVHPVVQPIWLGCYRRSEHTGKDVAV